MSKRIKIRAAKVTFDSAESLAFVKNGIISIYQKTTFQLSFEELYRNAYNLVLYKKGELLYDIVTLSISDYCTSTRQKIILHIPLPNHSEMQNNYLLKLKEFWNEHTLCLSMIRDILMYMDRTWVKTENIPDVFNLGQSLFRDIVLTSDSIQENLLKSFLHQIYLDRNGELVDILLLKGIRDMLLNFDTRTGKLYESIFEQPLLSQTREYYKRLSDEMLKNLTVAEYMEQTSRYIDQEQERARCYLRPDSLSQILGIIESELLESNLTILLEHNSGLLYLIENHKIIDLSRIYILCKRLDNGIFKLKKHLSMCLKYKTSQVTGLELGSKSRPGSASSSVAAEPLKPVKVDFTSWVESMLSIKDLFDSFLLECFQNDKSIQAELNDSMENAINQNSRSPEFLSLYIDENLKRGIKGKSEDEIEIQLDKTITLFRFLEDKDIFDRYYKQHLAKRLLHGKSLSEDAERSMISKFKIECGFQFTSKLEGMFNDMQVSRDLVQEFNKTKTPCSSSLSINILTSTFWPISAPSGTSCSIQYPSKLVEMKKEFESFYFSRHSGRRLTWMPNMGTCDIKIQFEKGKKEFNVSTFGMLVLDLFSERDSLEFSVIATETGISEADLVRVLQSLSMGKYKLLLKSSKGKNIESADVFTFNSKFTSPLNKIKILSVSGGGNGVNVENEQERSKTMVKVDESRNHQIEAAIVRIMKSRKEMDHVNLVSEVIDMLKDRFNPSLSMVKSRISGLIEREYLIRDVNDIKKYKYVA